MTPEFKNFLLDIDENDIAILTVNRPKAMNALNDEAYRELAQFVGWANFAAEVKAIIITGAGEKSFIAGADIGNLNEQTPVDALVTTAQDAVNVLADCAKPTIAAVNGYCLGGGCELALACDFRIVSENAMIGMPETGLGIIPGSGGTKRLPQLIGLGRARDMILLGKKFKGEKLEEIGFATACVPQEKLLDEAKSMAARILRNSPVALRLAKKILPASMTLGRDEAMLLEMLGSATACGTEDKKEGLSAFLEKRKPEFPGR